MTTPQGTAFMSMLAIGPPAIAIAGFLANWSIITKVPLAVTTICGLIYAWLLYRGVYQYFTSPLRNLPTPEGATFWMGHAIESIKAVPPGNVEIKWMKEVPNDGLIVFHGYFHMYYNLAVTTPETIMEVLNTHAADWIKPPEGAGFLERLIGRGLVVAEGSEHREQRKNVTPALSGRVIKDLVPLFWSKGVSLAQTIIREASTNDSVVEITEVASRATLDIIGSAGLGKDFATLENADHELAQSYSLIMDTKRGGLIKVFLLHQILPFSDWLAPKIPIEANARIHKATANLRRITKELLAEKRQDLEEKSVEQKDIIATLMRSGKHIDVQDRLREECRAICGRLDADEITAEVIDSMPYLEAVCNEVLRLYPPVTATSRRNIRDTRIGDQFIPKGSNVVLSPWAINRASSMWGPDAAEFHPDRWLGDKNGGATSPFAFLTFLFGPRSCIGMSFAKYELKCLVATLLMHTDLRLKKPDEIPIPSGIITIKPKEGLELIVKAI
ncbi:hypothetical protein LTR56_021166 [Elasticomyces elasticus]|nr:hypothetical protein LTR56_021166 [Elasticomyces elasticus]KAK3631771.1 hypothetical protein LTR22_020909 [Elasticomyces elasticus]KAK4909584.1 hypothetical protein LTR49_021628 [Elasticomyces elasticus]KAK5749489.1 hypothetical protein LTS12_020425 [Elasticomyces elasticus]